MAVTSRRSRRRSGDSQAPFELTRIPPSRSANIPLLPCIAPDGQHFYTTRHLGRRHSNSATAGDPTIDPELGRGTEEEGAGWEVAGAEAASRTLRLRFSARSFPSRCPCFPSLSACVDVQACWSGRAAPGLADEGQALLSWGASCDSRVIGGWSACSSSSSERLTDGRLSPRWAPPRWSARSATSRPRPFPGRRSQSSIWQPAPSG